MPRKYGGQAPTVARLRSRRLRERIRQYDASLAPYTGLAPVKAWKTEAQALLPA